VPRTEEAKQRMRDAQRGKILEAAGRVFARKGLAATVDDVAAEAGVSHGLAYRYFANKEAIYYQVVVQALQEPSARLQQIREMGATPGERLAALISLSVESRRDHPEFYQLLGQALGSEEALPELRHLARTQRQLLHEGLRHLIGEGQMTGEVRAADPDQLVRAIFACLEGLTRGAVDDPEHYREHFPDAGIFLRMLMREP
jgi:AcrR family transcriptional regulator